VKTGTVLPSTCQRGELFFHTGAPAGNMTPSAGVWDLSGVDALVLRKGVADPATCGVGELFVNTAATPVMKLCTSTNEWKTAGPPREKFGY
jgi:hypothetical protein